MIIMVVGDEHYIYWRKVLKADGRRPAALRPGPEYGAAPLRPHWISKYVKTVHLYQESGVTHEGYTHFANPHARDRWSTNRRSNGFGPGRPAVACNPSPDPAAMFCALLDCLHLWRGIWQAGIKIALSVKMVADIHWPCGRKGCPCKSDKKNAYTDECSCESVNHPNNIYLIPSYITINCFHMR